MKEVGEPIQVAFKMSILSRVSIHQFAAKVSLGPCYSCVLIEHFCIYSDHP
jgi:hypothetical protein